MIYPACKTRELQCFSLATSHIAPIMQPVESCCAAKFLSHVFKSIIFFIKIALKLSFYLQKKCKICEKLGGSVPQNPPCLRRLGGFAPRPPKNSPPPPLRISGYARDTWLISETYPSIVLFFNNNS